MTTTRKIACTLLSCVLCASSILLSSCKKQTEDIVESYETAGQVSEVTGVKEINFVPEGYSVSAHRSVYNIVSEVEYAPTEGNDKKNPKIVVFRIVDAVYTTSNLSGFEDTGLSEVYYPSSRPDLSLSIEARDEFLAVEWSDVYGGRQCNLSLSMTNGTVDEFKKIINGALSYITENIE